VTAVMTDEVDSDQSDFNGGTSRGTKFHLELWLPIFFTMEVLVMLVSFVLNVLLLRAVAKNRLKETPVYMFIMWLFFTKLVDDAVIIGQFIKYQQPNYSHTTTLCQFASFVVLGNRILQVNSVLTMVYYSWLHLEFKKTIIERRMKQFFPLVILSLLILELVMVIGPAVNVRASQTHQRCYYAVDTKVPGWLYYWVFPYILPLVLASLPALRIASKLRNASYHMTEQMKTQSYVVLAVCGGYFFFQLLYYTLTLWHLVAKDKEGFRAVIWFLLRPMFALIGYGWHLVTPLTPFVFDKDFYDFFPGRFVYRKKFEVRQEENAHFNSINLTPTNTWPSSNNNATKAEDGGVESKHVQFASTTSPDGVDGSAAAVIEHHHREFNNPVTMEEEISLEDERDFNNTSFA